MANNPSANQTNKSPAEDTKNIPASIGLSFQSTFRITKGNNIGDHVNNGVAATVRDAAGKEIALIPVDWTISATPTREVRIEYSGTNPQNARVYADNIQTDFKMTVTGTVRGYPVSTSGIITVLVV